MIYEEIQLIIAVSARQKQTRRKITTELPFKDWIYEEIQSIDETESSEIRRQRIVQIAVQQRGIQEIIE